MSTLVPRTCLEKIGIEIQPPAPFCVYSFSFQESQGADPAETPQKVAPVLKWMNTSPDSHESSFSSLPRNTSSFQSLPLTNSSHSQSAHRNDRPRTKSQVNSKLASAIILQSFARGVLARKHVRDRKRMSEYIAFATQKRAMRRAHEEELSSLNSALELEKNRSQSEKEAIDAQFAASLEEAKRKIRDEMEIEYAEGGHNSPEEAQQELMQSNHADRLGREARRLEEEIRNLEKQIDDLLGENSKLESANVQVNDMFNSLNEFARKKVEEKKDLVKTQRRLVDEEIPRAKRESAQAAQSLRQETRINNMFRSCMYSVLDVIEGQTSGEGVQEAQRLVEECEAKLGNQLLPKGDRVVP